MNKLSFKASMGNFNLDQSLVILVYFISLFNIAGDDLKIKAGVHSYVYS